MKKVCILSYRPVFTRFYLCVLLFAAGLLKAHGQGTTGYPYLFVENLDKFPSNDDFAASRVQVPWSRDRIVYNTNHDTLRIRIYNKGTTPLVISQLSLSNTTDWKINALQRVAYTPATALPLTIIPGDFADLQVGFVAANHDNRVHLLHDQLVISSNDRETPKKTISLHGLWQHQGEGSKEPTAQEMIDAFGFKTKTGFTATDPHRGANGRPKGDEVLTSYFVRVDETRPVTVRQMGAYHGCCNQSENLQWYLKGNRNALTTVVYHIPEDAQRILPRRNRQSNYAAAEGSFNPTGSFGFNVSNRDWTDTLLTPGRKIGIRVWSAIDAKGLVIPDAYIIANDYLGTDATNYDYNDNMYFVTNVRPELGPANASLLGGAPSAVDFEEQLLQSNTSFTLALKSLGAVHASGAKDPAISITAVTIEGEHNSEFSVGMPEKKELSTGEETTLSIRFRPLTEGLKVADLLIHYNNARSPLRVPLYGIGKASGTTVSVPYRINSGSSANLTVNGKTWVSDKAYAFDNLEPFRNTLLRQISATDDDAIYLTEQSSNGEKKPFRYELPLINGTYWVRLHFAEIYWGTPGPGLNGGAGSRVMDVQLENNLNLINLDVAKTVGSASAIVKVIPVTVEDGKLDIRFTASANRPMVNAIEVYQLKRDPSAPPPPIPALSVYPNPVHKQLTILFPADYGGEVNLQLTDVLGRIYELGKIKIGAGGGQKDIDLAPFDVKPGVYFLRIFSEKNKVQVIKLVVL